MPLPVIDLGRMEYAAAYEVQCAHHAEVLAAREAGEVRVGGAAAGGRILLVEHDPPVITISRRPDARAHLVATPELLSRQGVTVAETDRGGDITYHGPGQLVVYPIIDLNAFGLRLHDYMRLLEQAVIDALARFGVRGERDPGATGVWVGGGGMSDVGSGSSKRSTPDPAPETRNPEPAPMSKVCAMGVRIRKWVSLHGLALNVTTNLDHFGLIVPCGLTGRPVTSLRELLGDSCPTMDEAKAVVAASLNELLEQRRALRGSESAPPAL